MKNQESYFLLLLSASLLVLGCAEQHTTFIPPVTAATPDTMKQRLNLLLDNADDLRVVEDDNVGGTTQVALSVSPEKTVIKPLLPESKGGAGPGKTAPGPLRAKPAAASLRVSNPVAVKTPNTKTEIPCTRMARRDLQTDEPRTERPRRACMPVTAGTPGILSGTFAGAIFGSARGQTFLANATFTLVGTAEHVEGAWVSTEGRAGKLTGTLAGPSITAMRFAQLQPCSGTYAGVATIVENGSKLRGSYAGTDCQGKTDASFIVFKR